MDNRSEVREFLSSRRGRLSPEEAGLEPESRRRRVPGLRREEVARLASVSLDYYTRLERGNLTGVSETVLDAIAHALQLDRAEHDHLYDLARTANGSGRRPAREPRPDPGIAALQTMLDAITGAPAIVGNTSMDLVAANTLGHAMYSEMYHAPTRPANHARFIFLDPRAHTFYPDWERAASVNVAILRRDAGRYPHDRRISELVGELSVRSDRFRIMWAAHDVRRHYTGTKSFQHPVVGLLELTFHAMELQDDPGHSLAVYTAADGTTAERLQLLASWAATEKIDELARSS